jgi:hypothetical protein
MEKEGKKRIKRGIIGPRISFDSNMVFKTLSGGTQPCLFPVS